MPNQDQDQTVWVVAIAGAQVNDFLYVCRDQATAERKKQKYLQDYFDGREDLVKMAIYEELLY